MNIKNRLYMSAGFSIILIVILFSVVLVTSDRIAEEDRKHQLLMNVNRGIAELDILTYEYLLHREKRMEQQWYSKFNSLREILEKGAAEEALTPLYDDYVALGNLFSQITTNDKARQKLIQEGASQTEIYAAIGLGERLVAQILIASQSIFTDASRLAEEAHTGVTEAQRLAANLTLILMAILASAVTTSSLLIARSISKPLDKLTKGAEIIGKGELEHKVDIKTRDELGELAAAFNKMTENLSQGITERKQAEERTEHLSLVLRAIRNVNQLITKEKDRDKLLKGSCDNLVETRGYSNAWITLLDESGKLVAHTESGLGKSFLPMVEYLKRGQLPACGQRTLKQSEAVVIEDPVSTCADCPLSSNYAGRSAATVRLEYEGKVYGLLSVSVPREMATDVEELGLFREVATDIAFALHNIELEEKRKQVEEELEKSRTQYRDIVNNSVLGMAVYVPGQPLVFTNKRMTEITGYSVEEIESPDFNFMVLFTEEDQRLITANIKRRFTGEYFPPYESMLIPKTGDRKWVLIYNINTEYEGESAIQVQLLDITERKKAEEELRKHRNQLEELVKQRTAELENRNEQLQKEITERKELEEILRKSEKQASAAIEAARALTFSYDITTGEIEWGGSIEEITGYTKEEFAKVDINDWAERIHPDDRDEILSILQKAMGKDRATAEYRFRTKKGYVILSSLSLTEKEDGKAVRLVGILQDITKRKEMEEKLVRSEKLAVLGQLAGGVGHELRNPLGAIKNAAYFLNMALEEPEPEVKETLDILEKEVATSERIISSLLGFSRPKPPIRRKVDINEVIQETLYRVTVPENVKVVTQPGKSLPAILADPDQLGQVFSNVIVNAIQAMPEGGQLAIKSEIPGPEWVAFSFTDTGAGIPPEELQKVFEPLFSTKAKGIGLGLAVTKTLVEGHGGTIKAQSKVGKGSTFTVRLPIDGEKEK